MLLISISLKFVNNLINLLEDIFSGKDMKRMKAYISNVNEIDLHRKREEFWGTRVEGDSEIWSTLQACCAPDFEEGI